MKSRTDRARRVFESTRVPLLMLCGVITVFWKLALTRYYTFLDSPDAAEEILPWLQVQISAIRHGSVALWDSHEWFGQSLIGQLQPAVASPFTFLLALAPLSRDGQIQIFYVHIWFVTIHCVAALFAYLLFLDLKCSPAAAAIGGLFYAVAGFSGNTGWPQHLEAAIWAPLVFLFLLRSLQGRSPWKNAAWAGVTLGCSWLGGHHGPSLVLTLAAVGVCLAFALSRKNWSTALRRLGFILCILALVSAVQVLPSLEYGKRSIRWTGSGTVKWNETIPFSEHEREGLQPPDLVHIVLPGSPGEFDGFEGVVGLTLAALAIWGSFAKREVRLFTLLAVGALIYAMARNNPLYGLLYALCPLVARAREPIVAVSISNFAIAGLVALGADSMLRQVASFRVAVIQKALLWFSGVTFFLFYLVFFLRPTVVSGIADGDTRTIMSAIIALLLVALLQAWRYGHVRGDWLAIALCLVLVLEHGNEVGWGWIDQRDTSRATYLKQLDDNRDIGRFLKAQPNPKRIEETNKDIQANLGDWFEIDAAIQYTQSAPEPIVRLNWWQNRVTQMFGVGYTVSKAPTRPGQREVFSGKSGLKVFANPGVFPRAWTVHTIRGANDEDSGATLVRDGKFDLRREAVMVGPQPKLSTCATSDAVNTIDERLASVRIRVYMACRGMLIVSDNEYPGWRAAIDGKAAPIWRINTVIRGVVVDSGSHEVRMTYRPFSVYFGFASTLLGLAFAVVLQRRPEADGLDVMS